jgi:RNase P subunit RPR2
MSNTQPHHPGTVTIEYTCFNCGYRSRQSGLRRSPYPLWEHRLSCKSCKTQLVQGQWQEVPDSYGL